MYMKFFTLIILSLLITVSHIYAGNMSIDEKELEIDQKVAEFSQQSDWINVDSYIDFVGISELQYNEEEITLTQSYFDIFDYIPNTDNTLIVTDSLKDIINIKSGFLYFKDDKFVGLYLPAGIKVIEPSVLMDLSDLFSILTALVIRSYSSNTP